MNHLLILFCVFGVSLCASFTHFKVKQCEIEGNCINRDNSILIAIDGTGSRIYFEESNESRQYKSRIGVNHNKQWIWQSHIANFWEDYQGESYYFYGPDSTEMIFAGNEVRAIVEKSHYKVCQFINNYLINNKVNQLNELNDDFGIDIIGFSRGGFAAMELSRTLQFVGCNINGIDIKPIKVRWMGLYDPVQRDIDWGDILEIGDGYNNEEIAENVMNISIVERSRFIHSRSYFGYAVTGNDENKKEINASHSGIGGKPGKGDCRENPDWNDFVAKRCSESYTTHLDKIGAIQTEQWMRDNAMKSNVPILKFNGNQYYQNFVDIQIES